MGTLENSLPANEEHTRTSRLLAAVIALIGVLNWMGWLTSTPVLIRFAPDWPAMAPWGGLLLTLLAASLLLQSVSRPPLPFLLVARLMAGIAALVSLLMIFEYATGHFLGIDTWWFRAGVLDSVTAYPGRLSRDAAGGILTLSIVALTLRWESPAARRTWTVAITLGWVISVFILLNYLVSIAIPYPLTGFLGTSFVTASALFTLTVAFSLARPDRPITSWVIRRNNGNGVLSLALVLIGVPLTVWVSGHVARSWNLSENNVWLTVIATTIVVLGLGLRRMSKVQQARTSVQLAALKAQADDNAAYRLLLDHSADIVARLDENSVLWVSPSVTRTFGGTPESWVGKRVSDVLHPNDYMVLESLLPDLCHHDPIFLRGRIGTPRGDYHWVDIHASHLPADANGNRDLVCVIRIADEAVEALKKLEHLAKYDTVTGLTNRAEALRLLDLITTTPRSPGNMLAMLYCDIDDFKTVNDSFGHAAGDIVLSTVAERAQRNIRKNDIAARIGGDEFIIVLTDIHSRDEADHLAEKIRTAIEEPIPLDGSAVLVNVTVSIGVTVSGMGSGANADTMLSRADSAMYAAKRSGKNRIIISD